MICVMGLCFPLAPCWYKCFPLFVIDMKLNFILEIWILRCQALPHCSRWASHLLKPFLSRGAQCSTGRTTVNGLVIKTARLDEASHDLQRLLNTGDLEVERYLTSGSLHRTRQDRGRTCWHVARHYCQAIVYLPQIHPHHLPISRFFPKDPQNSWGPQNNKIGISLVHLKYPLKTREDLDQIFQKSRLDESCQDWATSLEKLERIQESQDWWLGSLDLTSLIKTGRQVWTSWKGFRKRKARIRVFSWQEGRVFSSVCSQFRSQCPLISDSPSLYKVLILFILGSDTFAVSIFLHGPRLLMYIVVQTRPCLLVLPCTQA